MLGKGAKGLVSAAGKAPSTKNMSTNKKKATTRSSRDGLQDIYQPNSEANPPDGLLAVPLLKHQGSWLQDVESGETLSVCEKELRSNNSSVT